MLLEDNPGMSQARACANVGIDPKTYRKWIATKDEMLQDFENYKREQERLEYAEILAKKRAVTDYFIKQAMEPGVSISERIKALEYIEKRIEELLSISERIKALEYIDRRTEELSNRYHVVDVEAEQEQCFIISPN